MQKQLVEARGKMVIFDMDNTLLQGRFIDAAAARFGFAAELAEIRGTITDCRQRTEMIAAFLKGRLLAEIIAVVEAISIVPDAAEVVRLLAERGYITGIVSDSYNCVTQYVKERLAMDFNLSNELVLEQGRATGRVIIPGYFQIGENQCGHDICKGYAVNYIAHRYGVELADIIAVGDSENDICMIKNAAVGVAFCSQDRVLRESAAYVIESCSFRELLQLAW